MMTIITFANVVRYGFNQNILWVLEQTVFLFGWLVLLGAFYAVKEGSHLGVDIFINTVFLHDHATNTNADESV